MGFAAWASFGPGCISRQGDQPVQHAEWDNVRHIRQSNDCFNVLQEVTLAPVTTENKTVNLPFYEMAVVESGYDPLAVGDRGRAIGLYQIHHQYWKDSGVPGTWEDCRDPAYSRRVIMSYWRRYCPNALSKGNLEILCRIHNGGPQGHKKKQTLKYWEKIQAVSLVNSISQFDLSD